jgi:hypothetical protein
MSGRDIVSTAMRLAREHVANAAAHTERKPSEAKIAAGNYRKGKINWHGLRISIENAKGSIRRGVDAKGNPWQVTMPASYGYVLRSVGADDDHIDLYMGPNPLAQDVWVIDQIDARNGKFDEHKVMAGFSSKDDAIKTYKKAFSDNRGHERIGAVTKMGIGQFKRWLARGDTTEPLGM